MSNCINSGINKVYILTQFNSQSLNRHLTRTYNFGNGVNFGDGFVEVSSPNSAVLQELPTIFKIFQTLSATQTPINGSNWFQGTADAVRQFAWLFEDKKNKDVEDVLILSGDHLYRMDYMDFVQVWFFFCTCIFFPFLSCELFLPFQKHRDTGADITISVLPMDDRFVKQF